MNCVLRASSAPSSASLNIQPMAFDGIEKRISSVLEEPECVDVWRGERRCGEAKRISISFNSSLNRSETKPRHP